jgi:hypothetical protein
MLAYPYPSPPIYNEAQLWQAFDHFQYKLLGGYAIFRSPNGSGTPIPPVLQPSTVQDLFAEAFAGTAVPPGTTTPMPVTYDQQTFRLIRTFLRRYDVETVAIEKFGQDPGLAIRYMKAVLGPPVVVGTMTLWFDVSQKLGARTTR